MFRYLKNRWRVSGWRLLLILSTFALGGSFTGYLGRKILAIAGVSNNVAFAIYYVIIIMILWPAAILLVSIPLGQLSFFRMYINRIGRRFTGKKQD